MPRCEGECFIISFMVDFGPLPRDSEGDLGVVLYFKKNCIVDVSRTSDIS